jgi:hypothetical protein
VQFYEENDGIDFGSGANIDDLFTGDCTLEAYMAIPGLGNVVYPLSKNSGAANNGWRFTISAANSVGFQAFFVTDNISINTSAIKAHRWYHVAVDWDVGTLTARMFLGGVLQSQGVAAGAYQVDAARNCICNGLNAVGTVDNSMLIGPIRLSNTRRYTGASFDPPRRINWPANDANAQLITRMNDGSGVTATDYSGNGYDGTITFGANTRWYNDPVE